MRKCRDNVLLRKTVTARDFLQLSFELKLSSKSFHADKMSKRNGQVMTIWQEHATQSNN